MYSILNLGFSPLGARLVCPTVSEIRLGLHDVCVGVSRTLAVEPNSRAWNGPIRRLKKLCRARVGVWRPWLQPFGHHPVILPGIDGRESMLEVICWMQF